MKKRNVEDKYSESNKKLKVNFSQNLTNYLVMNAIIKQDLFSVQKLLYSNKTDPNFNIDFCNKDGDSLIHVALNICEQNNMQESQNIVICLLLNGANTDVKNKQNITANERLKSQGIHDDSENTEEYKEIDEIINFDNFMNSNDIDNPFVFGQSSSFI